MEAKPGAIFMAMPSYDGKGEIQSAWMFFNCATRNLQNRLIFGNQCGSLLGLTFNSLLCVALNTPEVSDFVMLHADIIPEPGWLDILWEEREKAGADVISAVVPIKDLRGLTSTGLDDPKDPFNVLGRITTSEAKRLPETFDQRNTRFPRNGLLINTGCWLAKIETLRKWVDEYRGAFTIRDRIVRRPDGKYVAQVAPEDWNFSRDLARIGAKVVATQAVKLKHVGRFEFDSGDHWGPEFDTVYGEKFGSKSLIEEKENGHQTHEPNPYRGPSFVAAPSQVPAGKGPGKPGCDPDRAGDGPAKQVENAA
ncbi:MAG: hypothetical protein KGJ13_09360 [Patescibacteria group bacterium]|nr:hypothetical protein [Patescibacteria group bacterium]